MAPVPVNIHGTDPEENYPEVRLTATERREAGEVGRGNPRLQPILRAGSNPLATYPTNLSQARLPDLSNVAGTLGRGTLAAHRAVFRLDRELSLGHLGTVGPGGVLLD